MAQEHRQNEMKLAETSPVSPKSSPSSDLAPVRKDYGNDVKTPQDVPTKCGFVDSAWP